MTKSKSNETWLPAVFLLPLSFIHLSVKEPRVCYPLLWEKQEQVPLWGKPGCIWGDMEAQNAAPEGFQLS